MKTSLIKIRLALFCLCVAAATGARAQSAYDAPQPVSEVEVRLSLAGGKSVFRAGEAVRLVLSFTSGAAGFRLNTTTTKPASPVDEVLLSTGAGVSRWLDEYSAGGRYAPDYMSLSPLSRKPTTVELVLNEWVRFDRPGRYAVRVKTARVSGPTSPEGRANRALTLVTNEVGFEVRAMSAEDEAREVARLSPLLDAAKDWREGARLSEELSYLSGEPSTREKVRRYLSSAGRDGNYTQNITYGLMMARDRALAVRLLEAALRDPARPATPQLVWLLTALRVMLDADTPPAIQEPPAAPSELYEKSRRAADLVREEYIKELAASLPRRGRESRRATAMTLLQLPPIEPGPEAQLLAGAREVLLREFESLHPYDREYLLRVRWDLMRDASLAPALERTLAADRSPQDFQVRAAALMRLMEFDAQRARPFVIAELRDVDSFVDLDVLAPLEDATLPEADEALLAQIRALSGPDVDSVRLRQRVLLAARFASPAVYDGLMEVYRRAGSKWYADARGGLLGYFARWNEAQAAPLVEQALAETPPGQDQTFLTELTRSNYNDSIDALLRVRLEGAEPHAAGTAAYIMSQRGPESGRAAIEARLARWRKEWGGRVAELDADGADAALTVQTMVEVNLVEALLSGKRWKLSAEEAGALKRSCITKACRRRYPPK